MTSQHILRELGYIDPTWIEQAEPHEARGTEVPSALSATPPSTPPSTVVVSVTRPTRVWRFPRKLIACAVSLALIVSALSVVGFDTVSAAIRSLFSLIPGVGIEVVDDDFEVYAYEPVCGRVTAGDLYADVLRASYAKGLLNASIYVSTGIMSEDVRLMINGEPCPLTTEHVQLAYSSDASILEFAVPTGTPTDTDLYEIRITGFEVPLSFTLKPCKTYGELCEIGPTVTRNGIILTVTADRVENDVVIWYYETRSDNATKDRLAGFGTPANGSNNLRRYMETDNGIVSEKHEGWGLSARSVFEVNETDRAAVLHIPYLAMYRAETGSYRLTLPKDYTTVQTDYTAKTSLGVIKIVEIERTPDADNPDRDIVRLKLDYENKDDNQRIYDLAYAVDAINAVHYDGESGTMDVIDLWVDRDETHVRLTFDGIGYYLMEEYRFDLDIAP